MFKWGPEQEKAMRDLKHALVSPPALLPIAYTAELGKTQGRIVLGVDASCLGYGAILQQEDQNGKRHLVRYERGLWTDTERNYNVGKLECRALLRTVKKFGHYLYGIHFLVEIDAKTLIHQGNQPINDIPGAVVGRWLAYIRLFSFDIVHVPGTKRKSPDSPSQRPATEEEEEEREKNGDKVEEEIEEAIEGALWKLSVEEEGAEVENTIVEVRNAHRGGKEVDETERIVRWLLTMERPREMTDEEFGRFKREATRYLVRDGILYRRPRNRGGPPRKVISLLDDKKRILANLHDESSHRGRDANYTKVRNRFSWKGLYTNVDKFVQSCEQCQKRKPHRYDEPLHPTFSYSLWMKIGLDVVHMPTARDECKYLVGMRDDLSGWAE